MTLVVWVFGDSGEGTLVEARAYSAALGAVLPAHEIRVQDRLSSRKATFAAVVAWGVVEPRVVVLERARVLLGRLTSFLDPTLIAQLVRDALPDPMPGSTRDPATQRPREARVLCR